MSTPLSSALSPVAGAAGLAAPPAAVRATGFAQVLDAQRAQAAPAPAPDGGEAANAAARTAEDTRLRQWRAQRQAAPRPPEAPATPAAARPAGEAAGEGGAVDPARVHDDAPADDATRPTDPALADWLAHLHLHGPAAPVSETATAEAAAAAAATDPDARGAVAPSDLSATADAATRGAARRGAPDGGGASDAGGGGDTAGRDGGTADGGRRDRTEADDRVRGDAAPGEGTATGLPAGAAAWQATLDAALAPTGPGERARTGDASRVDGPAAAAALSGTAPLAERPAAEAAAPTVVHLPTPADAPDFPQALGTQVSVFARDGVQQAELHLNPAEMGSISIRISLDGDQAQVDFGADAAATRQLIEQGLPELASALRDAGFTLSGGGVHSQAQQPSSQQRGRERDGAHDRHDGAAGRGVGDDRNAPAGVAPVATRTVRAGGVDLYA